jgi:drug/metabolite transporter (DMT)-like permease
MLAAAFFFSLMSLLVKVIGDRMPAAEVVFFRSVFSVAATFLLLARRDVNPWGHRKGLLVGRGLVGFVALLCFFYAIPRLPLADVTVIQFTNPVFVAILAAMFLGEAIRRREIASLGLSIAGVLIIARPSFLTGAATASLSPAIVMIALCGAILAAVAYVLVRKLRETEDPLVVVLYFPLISAPACIPFLLGRAVWPTPTEWLLLVGVGAFTQIAQVNLTKGLHTERAARATSVSYTQIVFAAVWGMIFFGETPDLWVAAGALMVFVGATVVARGRPGI